MAQGPIKNYKDLGKEEILSANILNEEDKSEEQKEVVGLSYDREEVFSLKGFELEAISNALQVCFEDLIKVKTIEKGLEAIGSIFNRAAEEGKKIEKIYK